MIEFANVVKEYSGNTQALRGVSLQIDDGEFVFLVGASGAGKSTFTKLLIRELLPSEGNILVNGKSINRLKQRQIPHYRRNIGFIFQNYRLLADRTAFENVAFSIEVLGAHKREVERKVNYALHMVGLEDRKNHFPDELSGGEQQRVAIARAILRQSPIIVLDEATASVDVQTERQIQSAIRNLAGKRTVVAIAHRLSTIREADMILVLEDGAIIGAGDHEHLMVT